MTNGHLLSLKHRWWNQLNLTLWRDKCRAALIHLGLSAIVAAMVATVIFGLWFPWPYRVLAGGTGLFLLVAGVDIVIGPLLTFIVFKRSKPRGELKRDLSLVIVLQIAALAYGAWTMAEARPTHLVFEVDLFRVISAADLSEESMVDAPQALRSLPWTGPILIAAIPPREASAQYESIMRGMAGQHLAARPRYWLPYDTQRSLAYARAHSIETLQTAVSARLTASQHADLQAALQNSLLKRAPRWLPVVGRYATWITILGEDGIPRVFVPIDPY